MFAIIQNGYPPKPEEGDFRLDCLSTKPCVACWRGEGRNTKLLGMAGRFAAGGEARELEVAVVAPSCPSSSPPPSVVARSAAGRWVQDIEIYGQNGHTYWSVFLTETNIYYLLSDLCHVFSCKQAGVIKIRGSNA